MQHLRIVVAQCLVTATLLGQESITNIKTLNKANLTQTKPVAIVASHRSRALTTTGATPSSINTIKPSKAAVIPTTNNDEDAIVYSGRH